MIYHRSTTAAALLLACLASAPASAQGIDQTFYYKLSTQFRGSGMKLDVLNGGPKNNMTRLEPDQDVSGQFWRFVGNPDGTFRISSLFRGPGMCLDIFNGGAKDNQSHLTGCGNFTGQFWSVGLAGQGELVRLTTSSAALACAWISSMAARTTTNPILPSAMTSRASSGP